MYDFERNKTFVPSQIIGAILNAIMLILCFTGFVSDCKYINSASSNSYYYSRLDGYYIFELIAMLSAVVFVIITFAMISKKKHEDVTLKLSTVPFGIYILNFAIYQAHFSKINGYEDSGLTTMIVFLFISVILLFISLFLSEKAYKVVMTISTSICLLFLSLSIANVIPFDFRSSYYNFYSYLGVFTFAISSGLCMIQSMVAGF